MMRYQRVSPDCLGLPNGRKPTIRPFSTADSDHFRARSGSGSVTGSATHIQDNDDSLPSENQKSQNNHPGGGGGDVLLQWGHKKRSRGSRAENRTVADDSSLHSRRHIKIQRRAAIAGDEKIAAAEKIASTSAMPPPGSGGGSGGYPRGANLRACMPLSNNNRSVEERSNAQHQPDKRSPPSPPPHRTHHNNKAPTASANGFGFEASTSMNPDSSRPSDQETAGSGSGGGPTMEKEKEKVNLEQLDWPRIYISLSRKEKEDDFLAMKGTKLPQRPKKRAKNVDKSLQYCFPGMWLSDLTRGRYEVREKKCAKKKRRGLKGMESMDSDSE